MSTLFEMNFPRHWYICNCYCDKCKTNHSCVRPEYFVDADFDTTSDTIYCCMKRCETKL